MLFDKYYVERRYNRKNDFRASGAKKFDLNFKLEYGLLDYAKEIYSKFNTPYLSIDIGFHNNKYYLFEFQASHFGINVMVNSKGYYRFNCNEWKFTKRQSDIETEFTNALIKYIKPH